MENLIIGVLKYFSFFDYPPTAGEVYTFLKKKASFGRFMSVLEKMIKEGVVISHKQNNKVPASQRGEQISNYKSISNQVRYTVGEYSKKVQSSKFKVQSYRSKFKISQKKLQNWRFRFYLRLLTLFPQIKLIGLSGSISMTSAGTDDDIDLFVITARNRLFTGRFITLAIAQILGLRRLRNVKARHRVFSTASPQRGPRQLSQKQVFSLSQEDKVCLNLFFDESDLAVPKFKRSEYVAHEVLQMKPIINKNYAYERFLQANLWVKKIFPNTTGWTSSKFKVQSSKLEFKIQNYFKNFKLLTSIFNFSLLTFNLVGGCIELILRKFQLSQINRHRTTEIVTDSQLWFHPQDFNVRIKKSTSW